MKTDDLPLLKLIKMWLKSGKDQISKYVVLLISIIAGLYFILTPFIKESSTNTIYFQDTFDDESIDSSKWIKHDIAGDYIQERANKILLLGDGGEETRSEERR